MILLLFIALLLILLFGAGSNFRDSRNTFLWLILAIVLLWLILGAPR